MKIMSNTDQEKASRILEELRPYAKENYRPGDRVNNGAILEAEHNAEKINLPYLHYDLVNDKLYMGNVLIYIKGNWAPLADPIETSLSIWIYILIFSVSSAAVFMAVVLIFDIPRTTEFIGFAVILGVFFTSFARSVYLNGKLK